MTFAELKGTERREIYDQWLTKVRHIGSSSFRSTISRYNLYNCSDPAQLIEEVAQKLQDDNFIHLDNLHHRNDSTPMRRYLEWVNYYMLENFNDNQDLLEAFHAKLVSHEDIFLRGAYRLTLDRQVTAPLQTNGNGVQKLPLVEAYLQNRIEHHRNRIVYGAPGTGKSYLLKQQTSVFPLGQVERVTFHPEYTYFDFVGSYKPVMVEQDGKEVIAYRFEAGPFAKILKKALDENGREFVLVIEEINRARAAAVFGDLFQLLDRDSEGRSEYGITPARDLANYLTRDNEDGDGVELEGGKLYLPDNLYIWATMNSADQGVFPLDTAFKRRWSFEYIPIDNNEDKITGPCSAKWNEIRKHANKLLQEAGINEDKQMGAFFLKGEELANERNFLNAIKEKVIMYLYEDAARHQRGQLFKNERARFSELCNIFDGTIASIFKEVEGETHA